MGTVLIISILLLVITSFVIHRTKRSSRLGGTEEDWLLTAPPRGLFDEGDAGVNAAELSAAEAAEREKASAERAAALRARAEQGDREALSEAHASGDRRLYGEVLDALVRAAAGSVESTRELSDFIVRGEGLRAAPALAGALEEIFNQAPTQMGMLELLRVAALSDDAGAYRRAVEAVSRAVLDGRLAGVSAEESLGLFESEYWILSADARRSGAGFQLKETLADVRRLMAARGPRRANSPSPKPDESAPAST